MAGWRILSLFAYLLLAAAPFSPARAESRNPVDIVPQISHAFPIEALQFTDDGQHIVSMGGVGTIKVWNARTGRLVRTITEKYDQEGKKPFLTSAYLSGNTFIAGSTDGVRSWDISNGSGAANSFKYLKDDLYRFVGGNQKYMLAVRTTVIDYHRNEFQPILVDRKSNAVVRTLSKFKKQAGTMLAAALSPDGAFAVFAFGTVEKFDEPTNVGFFLWNLDSGRIRSLHQYKTALTDVAFSRDGTRLAVGDQFGSIDVWSMTNRTKIKSFKAHEGQVSSIAFVSNDELVTASGRTLATKILFGSSDNSIKLWSIPSGKLLRSFEPPGGEIVRLALSNDRRRLAAAVGKDIKVWRISSGKLLNSFRKNVLPITSTTFSRNGRVLATTGGGKPYPRLWDLDGGNLLRTLDGPSEYRGTLVEDAATIFVDNDNSLISGGRDNSVKRWDTQTGRLLDRFNEPSGSVLKMAVTPDEKYLATASDANMFGSLIRLWDLSSGTVARELKGHERNVESFSFSEVGTNLVSSSSNEVFLWDYNDYWGNRKVEPASQSRYFDDSLGSVWSGFLEQAPYVLRDAYLKPFESSGRPSYFLYCPDGASRRSVDRKQRRFVAGYLLGQVCLWNLDDGERPDILPGHTGKVTSVAMSPNGDKLVSASMDGTLKIWRESGKLAASIVVDRNDDWVTFTPEGFFSASNGADNVLSIVDGLRETAISQIFQSLHNPDLVRESLNGDSSGDVKRASNQLNLEWVLSSGEPPDISVVDNEKGGFSSKELIDVTAFISEKNDGGIGRIEWRVNGLTVGVETPPIGASSPLKVSRKLALDPGENTIEVVAYNGRNLVSSLPAKTTVAWTGKRNKSEKPRLFVVAFGVKNYDPTKTFFKPLTYPVSDAVKVGKALSSTRADDYGAVEIVYLLDDGTVPESLEGKEADVRPATAESLKQVLEELGPKMHPRDTFIFFASGHGFQNYKVVDGRFFIVPYGFSTIEMSQGKKLDDIFLDTAIGQDKLQTWIANNIKAKRGLILLDACNSGASVALRDLKKEDTLGAAATLGRLHEATGRPVITASAAYQAAIDGYKKHGVFAYALLDGLANADVDGDDKIEVRELANHIQSMVPKISTTVRVPGQSESLRQKPKTGSRGENFAIVGKADPVVEPFRQ